MTTPYHQAQNLDTERADLVRERPRLPVRERLVRGAALADRDTLNAPEADGKAVQHLRSAALRLVAHDLAHGTAAGPLGPNKVTDQSATELLRAYIRQEYTAWLGTA